MNQIKTAFQQTSVLKIKWYLDLSLNVHVVNDKGEDLGIAVQHRSGVGNHEIVASHWDSAAIL